MEEQNYRTEKRLDHDEHASNRRGLIIGAVVVVLVIVGIVWWLVADDSDADRENRERSMAVPEQPAEAQPEPEPAPEPEPEPAPEVPETPATPAEPEEPEVELPALAESTPVVLERFDQDDVNARPIQSNQLIRDTVVFVDNLRNGTMLTERTIVAKPDGQFRVMEIDDELYIDERSYDRYNALVDWFVSLDVESVLAIYADYEPLVNEAYAEIGYPDTAFEGGLVEAIEVLLDTPEVDGLIEVTDDEVMYTYADPSLEALPPAQKQLLRTGPENVERVKRKLREFRDALNDD